jgi:hypothetical protein
MDAILDTEGISIGNMEEKSMDIAVAKETERCRSS